ncbi:unnamed protein product, partial [Laminaria digitata]
MSDAAVTAGASPLDSNWSVGSLLCTKPGLKGGPRVLDLAKIITAGGSNLAQLSVLECVTLLAPLVQSLGYQEVPSFQAMADATVAAEATVGTVAFKKAAGPRVIAAWALEGLRGQLYERGAKVFLPALPTPGATDQQPPATQQEQAVRPAAERETGETAPTPAASSSQEELIRELRAKLQEAEASQTAAAADVIVGKGPGAPARAAAATVEPPTAAQQQAANDALQKGENRKFVDLVQSRDVTRE